MMKQNFVNVNAPVRHQPTPDPKLCEFDLAIKAMEIEALIANSKGIQSNTSLLAYKLAREQDPTFVNSPQFGSHRLNRNYLSPDKVGVGQAHAA